MWKLSTQAVVRVVTDVLIVGLRGAYAVVISSRVIMHARSNKKIVHVAHVQPLDMTITILIRQVPMWMSVCAT